MDEPLYVDRPPFWTLSAVIGTFSGVALFSLWFFVLDAPYFGGLLVIGLLAWLNSYAINPREMKIFPDRLEFVLGFTRWSIPLDSIVGIASPTLPEMLLFCGVRFGGW